MEYMSALEKEIAMEVTIADIGQKVMSIFKFIGELIRKAIKFLTGLIGRLKKTKTQQESGPVAVDKNGKVIPYDDPNVQANIQATINRLNSNMNTADLYDCGNELERVVDDVRFCIEMLIKRPKPDHKTGKGYGERWAGDNELIADRMAKAMEILEKLDGIEKKTIDVDKAEMLKGRLEALNAQYDKYSRIYDMFVKKNQHTTEYFIGTITSFHMISDVAGKALNIILKLQDPKG